MTEQRSEPAEVSANEQELQRSSDVFLGEVGRIDGLERQKRAMKGWDDQRLRSTGGDRRQPNDNACARGIAS